MPSSATHVTDAELAVLEVLWEKPRTTIRAITNQMYGEGTTSEYATVQKLLERLENKNCVERDRTGFAHTFEAIVSRRELIDGRLQEVADKLTGGSWTPLLTHLVDGGRLSAKDLQELQQLIDQAPRSQRRKGRSR